jgi:hypothetical protein
MFWVSAMLEEGRVPVFKFIMCRVYKIILHRSIGATTVFDPKITHPPYTNYFQTLFSRGFNSPSPLRFLFSFMRFIATVERENMPV